MAFDFTHLEVKREFNIDLIMKEFKPNYNAAPSQEIPVIVAGSRVLNLYKWGLIPHWAKDPKIAFKLINARAETLEDKPSFRNSFHKYRCAIVCSGFFEWKSKIPYYFQLKNKKMFTLAGLASAWKDKNKKTIQTCTVITTSANNLVKKIHDRMPVILNKKDIDKWISPNTNINEIKSLLSPYPPTKMTSFSVDPKINSVKNNTPDLLKPKKLNIQKSL